VDLILPRFLWTYEKISEDCKDNIQPLVQLCEELSEGLFHKLSRLQSDEKSVGSLPHQVQKIKEKLWKLEHFGSSGQKSEILLTKKRDKEGVVDWSRSMKLEVTVHGYKFDLDIFPKFLDVRESQRAVRKETESICVEWLSI
jgi:hypothetical protein